MKTILFLFIATISLMADDIKSSPPSEFHCKVLQVIPSGGLYVQLYSLQAIPGTSGTVGAGGFVRRPQGWFPSEKFALLYGYPKKIADGEVIAIMATQGEVVSKTSTDGISVNLQSYNFVTEKNP